MIRVGKQTILLIVVSTTFLLAYVHEQVAILRLSYAIEHTEKELAARREAYRAAKFRVDQLHSPHYLDQQVREKAINLTIPKTTKMIRVIRRSIEPAQMKTGHLLRTHFLSLLGSMREAKAETSN